MSEKLPIRLRPGNQARHGALFPAWLYLEVGSFAEMPLAEYLAYEDRLLEGLSEREVGEIMDLVDYHESRLLGMTHDEAIADQRWEVEEDGDQEGD